MQRQQIVRRQIFGIKEWKVRVLLVRFVRADRSQCWLSVSCGERCSRGMGQEAKTPALRGKRAPISGRKGDAEYLLCLPL